MTTATTIPVTRAICEHCAETLDDADCGTATITAYWVSADQEREDSSSRICRECLYAGCSTPPTEGPGYVDAVDDAATEVSR